MVIIWSTLPPQFFLAWLLLPVASFSLPFIWCVLLITSPTPQTTFATGSLHQLLNLIFPYTHNAAISSMQPFSSLTTLKIKAASSSQMSQLPLTQYLLMFINSAVKTPHPISKSTTHSAV